MILAKFLLVRSNYEKRKIYNEKQAFESSNVFQSAVYISSGKATLSIKFALYVLKIQI